MKHIKTLFVREDFLNLVKMDKLAGIFAGFLPIKSVLGDDGKGEIVLYKKSRGSKKAFKSLIETMEYCGKELKLCSPL